VYVLRWEAVNTLLVMASTQLYTPTATAAAGAHPFTAAMLEQGDLVPGLLQVGPVTRCTLPYMRMACCAEEVHCCAIT
jgi:hypothetical protein